METKTSRSISTSLAFTCRCAVCGAVAGLDCIEVFGVIAGVECGCTACIGVTHFPDHDEIRRRLADGDGEASDG